MADVTHKELAAARKAVGLYQHQVAYLMHVSEDVISDWETGKTLPTPDQVDDLCKIYKMPWLWYGWMRYHYKSFRDRCPEQDSAHDKPLATVMTKAAYEMADVQRRQEQVIRDVLDGKVNDKAALAVYLDEAKEAIAALLAVAARAGRKEG